MTAAIDAKPEDMSRGQLEAAVKLLRDVADKARRYREASTERFPNHNERELTGSQLDHALVKVGMP